jgi:hypothetical protein
VRRPFLSKKKKEKKTKNKKQISPQEVGKDIGDDRHHQQTGHINRRIFHDENKNDNLEPSCFEDVLPLGFS